MKVSKNFGVMKSVPTIGGFIVTSEGCFFKVKCSEKYRLVKWTQLQQCPYALYYKYKKNLRITAKSVSWHVTNETTIQKAKTGIFYEL